ncbi:MAG: glycosyltransferase family 2 protein [Candidatus Desantisbacteria bacterium]
MNDLTNNSIFGRLEDTQITSMISLPNLAVIIINWNSWKDTIECLESLLKSECFGFHLIILDNGSMDNSIYEIKKWLKGTFGEHKDIQSFISTHSTDRKLELFQYNPTTYFIVTGENFGFCNGNNIAIEHALLNTDIEYVFLLNNDTKIKPNCLIECIESAKEIKADIIGAMVKSIDGNKLLFGGRIFPDRLFFLNFTPTQTSRYFKVDRVEGSGMVISRKYLLMLKELRGYYFDPLFFMYCEDVELCLRAKSIGLEVGMARDAILYHKHSKSSGGHGNPYSYYYITRNRIFLAKMFLSLFWKIIFHVYYISSRMLSVLFKIIRGKRIVANAIIEALIDGYFHKGGKWQKHIG